MGLSQIAENAGFDATDILNRLRQAHATGKTWYGVDINSEDIGDNYENFVWEPTLIRRNAIASASEAASLILSVDETVKNPQSEQADHEAMKQGAGAGAGRPMMMPGM